MENLGLVFLLLASVVVINTLLSAIIFSRGLKNLFNILFGLISFGVVIWSVAIAGFYSDAFHASANWLAWTHSSALFIALTFFYFSNAFPQKLITDKSFYTFAALPFLVAVYYLFSDGLIVGETIGFSYEIGSGYFYYQALLMLYFVAGYALLIAQYKRNTEAVYRQQIKYVFIGSVVASFLGIITNLVFPFLNIFTYTWLGPVFTIALVVSIFIAILRYHLFSIKLIVSEFFALVVLILLILNIFINGDSTLFFTAKAFVLIAVSVFLYFFIRAVYKIEKLVGELEQANKQQGSLIHLISHEVKNGLGKANDVFAEIVEGSFDADVSGLKEFTRAALHDNRKVVEQVEDVLRSADFKTGKISYDKKPFDFREALQESTEKYKAEAEAKGLAFRVCIAEEQNYTINGDRALIVGHLFKNLLENAINFTPQGSIVVSLSARYGKVMLAVTDTGIGITPDDMKRLFTEGGHGKDSIKINVHSTGYGLFIVKQIVEAHGGRIWAESEGPGKGATFFVEVPVS